jgi:hypothetical protein
MANLTGNCVVHVARKENDAYHLLPVCILTLCYGFSVGGNQFQTIQREGLLLSKVLGFWCENSNFQTGPLSPATIEQVKETPEVLDGVSAQCSPDREEDIR